MTDSKVPVHMNAIPASDEEKWDFSFATMDSWAAAVYFTAPEKEGNHRGYLVMERFVDTCSFLRVLFKKVRVPPLFP